MLIFVIVEGGRVDFFSFLQQHVIHTNWAVQTNHPGRQFTEEPMYSGSVGFHLFAVSVGRKLMYAQAARLWNTAEKKNKKNKKTKKTKKQKKNA
jgi:hypothetical protein